MEERPPHPPSHSWPLHDILAQAMGLVGDELVAFVGAGGKTGLMFALGQELAAAGRRVVITTTTRLFGWQMALAPAACTVAEVGTELVPLLTRHRLVTVVTEVMGDKAHGVPQDLPALLLRRAEVDTVLVEADGARRRPVKAPAAHEPALPDDTGVLVIVVGIDALDGPIGKVAHRPEQVSRLTGKTIGERLTPVDIATLLTHPDGGLKDAPETARRIAFINKVETAAQLTAAREIATAALREPGLERVIIGAVQREQPVAAILTRGTTPGRDAEPSDGR